MVRGIDGFSVCLRQMADKLHKQAGTDCVMICHTMSAQVGAIEQVVQAVRSGQLSQDAIQASIDRVNDLKARVCTELTSNLPLQLKDYSTDAQFFSVSVEARYIGCRR